MVTLDYFLDMLGDLGVSIIGQTMADMFCSWRSVIHGFSHGLNCNFRGGHRFSPLTNPDKEEIYSIFDVWYVLISN